MFKNGSKYLIVIACASTLLACGTDYSAANSKNDATITSHVLAAFASDPQLKSAHLEVTTTEGVVYISGVVDSITNDERAIELAHRVESVGSVKDNIAIRSLPESQ